MILLAAIAASSLTPLLKECGAIPASHGACDSDIYKPVWRKIIADNGEITKVDMASTQPFAGGARATIYTYTAGTRFDPSQMSTLHFDCRGKYEVEGHGGSEDAPPRSVVGRVATIVCSKAGQ